MPIFIRNSSGWRKVNGAFIRNSSGWRKITNAFIMNTSLLWRKIALGAGAGANSDYSSKDPWIEVTINPSTNYATLTGTNYHWTGSPTALTYDFLWYDAITDSWTSIQNGTITNPSTGANVTKTIVIDSKGTEYKVNQENMYHFRVTATINGKQEQAESIVAYVYTPFDIPSISATPVSAKAINVSWSPSQNAAGYQVYYTKSGGSEQYYNSTTSTSMLVQGLESQNPSGIQYSFRIVPYTGADPVWGYEGNDKTTSGYTSPPPPPPNTPTGIYVDASQPNELTVMWDASAGADYYQLSHDGITSFANSSDLFYTESGLQNSVIRYYYVRAVGEGGNSAWSSQYFGITKGKPFINSGTGISFTSTNGSNAGSVLTATAGDWLGNPSPTYHIDIYASLSDPFQNSEFKSSNYGTGNSTSYTVSQFDASPPPYRFRATMYASNTYGDSSIINSGIIDAMPGLPVITFGTITSSSIAFSYSSDRATYCRIDVYDSITGYSRSGYPTTISGSSGNITVSGLTANRSYSVSVRGTNTSGNGQYAIDSRTTSAAGPAPTPTPTPVVEPQPTPTPVVAPIEPPYFPYFSTPGAV